MGAEKLNIGLTPKKVHEVIDKIDSRIIYQHRIKQSHEIGSKEYIQAIYKEAGLKEARDIILSFI